MKTAFAAVVTAFWIFWGIAAASAADEPPRVTERVIRIEGSLERPRIIYIVPRARLWKEGFGGRSFVSEILAPVYPDELINNGQSLNNRKRR